MPLKFPELGLKDLELRATLGTGSFGRVRLVRHIVDTGFYALKILKKSEVVYLKQVDHVKTEKKILEETTHPFIVNLIGAFQDPYNLYLLLEYIIGGEFFSHLRKAGRFPNDTSRYYAAQITLVFEHLHGLQILYRDLKPENLLLDSSGNCKVTDFGFAKKVEYRTWTLCGTPEYLAPEIILEKGHGKAVDYWALGVLFYEMLNGHSPFEAEDHLATYQKVLDGTVTYPPAMNPDAVDLISKLLQKDISRRFGNLREGAKDIKEHAFFKGASFPWDAPFAMRGSIKPDEFDKSKYEWFPAEQLVTETKTCRKEDQALFDGF